MTAFFREAQQFEYLASQLLPRLLRERTAALRGWDVAILATDIDTDAPALAARGVYPLERMGGVSRERLRRFFLAGSGEQAGKVRAGEELRALISFRDLNLLGKWPMRGHGVLAEDGHLFVGHAENLCGFRDWFEPLAGAIYRRRPAPEARPGP